MPCDPITSWGTSTAPSSAFSGRCAAPPSSAFTTSSAPVTTWDDGCTETTPAPTLTSLNPATGGQGATVSVILVGTNFTTASVVAVSGAGVTVQNVVFYSDVGLTADFVITAGASASTRTVTVTTVNGTSNTVNFVVTSSILGVNGRELWLDANVSATLTIATGVSSWADCTGNGRALAQATGAKQPTVVAALQNGLPGVRFDGVNDFLSAAPAVELKNGSTVFVVVGVNFANTTKGHGLFRLTSNPTGIQHEPSDDGTSPSKLEMFASTNAGLKRATPAAVTTTGVRLITARVSPSDPAVTLYKNGVLNGGPTAGFASLVTSVADTWRLCTDESESTYCGQYDVFELLVYSAALTVAQQQVIEAILMIKWGLP